MSTSTNIKDPVLRIKVAKMLVGLQLLYKEIQSSPVCKKAVDKSLARR